MTRPQVASRSEVARGLRASVCAATPRRGSLLYNMRKNRVVEQNRCYHLVSRLAHRAFFLDDEEKDRAVALMRRVEAGVNAIMSYCINRAVSINPTTLTPPMGILGF